MMQTPSLPFYKVTGTPHFSNLGSICIHHWAAIDRQDFIQKTMEDSGLNSLLVTDYYGNTVLHYATSAGSYKVAKYVISLFPSTHFFNSSKITPAHIAAQRNDVKMLEILRESSVLFTDLSHKLWSPFHFAIFYGSYESVLYFLKNGFANLNQLILGAESTENFVSNNTFRYISALDLAEITNNQKIVDLLNEYHALPSLHTAIRANNLPAVGFHIFSPVSPSKNLDAPSQYRNSTPLHIAAALGNYSVCHSLLEKGCSTELVDSEGLSPLELAVISNSVETVTVILPRSSTDQVAKAIFIAADLNHRDVLKVLLGGKFSPSHIDSNSYKTINQSPSKVNCKENKNGDSILIRLIKRKMFDFAEILLKMNPDINYRDSEGATALHYAAVSGPETLLRELLYRAHNKEEKDKFGMTPYFYAIRSSSNFIRQFPTSDIDALNEFGLSPIVYAIALMLHTKLIPTEISLKRRYNVDIGKFLDAHKLPKITRSFPDYKQDANMTCECAQIPIYGTPFVRALKAESPSLFREKLGGIVPGGSLLHLAIIFEARSGVVKQLLDKNDKNKIDLLDRPDDYGRTPLHYAIILHRTSIISLLIALNANVMVQDNEGNTIYHFLDDVTVYETIREILTNASITSNSPNKDGDLPIHIACRKGCLPMLKIFVQLLEDIKDLTRKNNKGETPLGAALANKNYDCIEFLHSYGVSNLLVEAVRENDIKKVQRLIENGYPVNSFDKSHITSLHAATDNQNAEIVKYLIDHGAEPKVQTLKGQLPIHFAATHNNLEICLLLLTDDFKLSTIHSADQPFLMATEENCKNFLFHYWKREVLIKYLMKFIKRCYGIFLNIKGQFQDVHDKFNKNKLNSTMLPTILTTISKIIFVSERILARRRSQSLPYSFKYSLHHLLQILTSFDITNYCNELESVQDFFEDCKTLRIPVQKIIYQLLYPLFWIDNIGNVLLMLTPHLLTEIDNGSLFSQILTWTSLQCEKVMKYQPLGIPKDDDSLAKEITENVIVTCDGVIDEIQKNPLCLFHPQFFDGMKDYLGKKYTIPRNMPFRNRDTIRIYLCEKFVVFIGRQTIKLPLFMINIKQLTKENEFTFTTPIGQFKITISIDDPLLQVMKVFILHKSIMLHRFDHGEYQLQRNKERMYQCLVVFQLSGERSTSSRFVTVRAGTERSCYDICHAHMMDSLPSPPVFFNVMPRDITDSEKTVIFT